MLSKLICLITSELLISLIIVSSISLAQGRPCGEIWFYIDDDITNDYKVIAQRVSLNDPLFRWDNHMEVDNHLYDEVTSEDVEPINYPFNWELGFDYVGDPNQCWPLIGFGILEFEIYRNDVMVFKFKINLIHLNGSPDIKFEYLSVPNTVDAITNNYTTRIEPNSYRNVWDLRHQERDISYFVNNVQLTNSVAGEVKNEIKTIFSTADMGFPYNDVQLDFEYNPGTTVRLWRGVYYVISSS